MTEIVSGSLAAALKRTGDVGKALTGAVTHVATGVIEGASQVGGDLGKAAKGAAIGVLQRTKEVGANALDAIGSTAEKLVKREARQDHG